MSTREGHEECAQGIDAAPYVLGTLEDQERYREHLTGCRACRAEVAELQLVADRLPSAVTPLVAPASMRARVMAQARSEAALLRAAGAQADEPPREPRWRARRISLAAAAGAMAAAAAVAVLVALSVSSSPRERVTTGQAVAGARVALRSVDGRSELVVSGMPQPPLGKIYEVWLGHGSEAPPQPTNALFGVTATGAGSVAVPSALRHVKEVLVTAEPLGGSSRPTSAPLIRVPV